MTKLVSIILPVYNGSKYLARAIETSLEQTYKNIELIIVDDCSTDSSLAIARSFKDTRVRIVQHSKNMGLPTALNSGFAASTGAYLTWTSDDNEYYPHAVERLVECLSGHPTSQFVYANYRAFWENESRSEPRRLRSVLNHKVSNGVGACFMYTREVYTQVGEYRSEYFLIEDFDYWIRISKSFQAIHCDQELYMYRYHGSSLTGRKKFRVMMLDVFLRLEHSLISFNEARREVSKITQSLIAESTRTETMACMNEVLMRLSRMSLASSSMFLLMWPSLFGSWIKLKLVR